MYEFAHILFMEVAYESLLWKHRRLLHRRAAHHATNKLQEALQENREWWIYEKRCAQHWLGAVGTVT